MHLVTLDIDGRERARRTDILTGTAADAHILIDYGNLQRLLIIRIGRYHLDGTSRTVTSTVAARHTVGERNTVLLDPDGMANLNRGFLHLVEWLNRSGRAHIRTARALRTTIATLVRHRGLHQVHQVGRGTEHMVRALRDTELAPRAVRGEILERERTRRCEWCLALRSHLFLQFGDTTIHQFLFLLSKGCSRGKGRGQEERAL